MPKSSLIEALFAVLPAVSLAGTRWKLVLIFTRMSAGSNDREGFLVSL
jgi:hypothetical protein